MDQPSKVLELMQCIHQYHNIVHHKCFPMCHPIFDIRDDIRKCKIHHYLYTFVSFEHAWHCATTTFSAIVSVIAYSKSRPEILHDKYAFLARTHQNQCSSDHDHL